MKKALEIIGSFAGIYFFIQLFSYFKTNGLAWNANSFVDHILLYFVALVGFSIIICLFYLIKKPNKQPEEPITDERTEKMHFKFTGFMFILSYFILLIGAGYLVITNQNTIPTQYILYYAFGALFINMIVAPLVIKKL
ncbi:hypothetical protein SFC65_19200 [Priestia filamentosa]|uniref:hypothetical protein n=1 Tax=Priestia filamentosa TaxID=1402861 RepID=UPI003982CC23